MRHLNAASVASTFIYLVSPPSLNKPCSYLNEVINFQQLIGIISLLVSQSQFDTCTLFDGEFSARKFVAARTLCPHRRYFKDHFF